MIQSNATVNVHPRFQMLAPDQVEEMHYATLEVLRRTGVRVLVPEARELLQHAGCWADGDRVPLPGSPDRVGAARRAARSNPVRPQRTAGDAPGGLPYLLWYRFRLYQRD